MFGAQTSDTFLLGFLFCLSYGFAFGIVWVSFSLSYFSRCKHILSVSFYVLQLLADILLLLLLLRCLYFHSNSNSWKLRTILLPSLSLFSFLIWFDNKNALLQIYSISIHSFTSSHDDNYPALCSMLSVVGVDVDVWSMLCAFLDWIYTNYIIIKTPQKSSMRPCWKISFSSLCSVATRFLTNSAYRMMVLLKWRVVVACAYQLWTHTKIILHLFNFLDPVDPF